MYNNLRKYFSIIHVIFSCGKNVKGCFIYICSFIHELLQCSLLYYVSLILNITSMFPGFYTPAEFEKYMRYLEGPRKRQYESDGDTHTASSPTRREPISSPVLLKRRRAKQTAAEGTKYVFNKNNCTHLVCV